VPRSRSSIRSFFEPIRMARIARAVCQATCQVGCQVGVLACVAGSTIAAPGVGSTIPAKAASQPDAAARLERYPTDLDFLLAVDGLSQQRATRAGFAAERFLSVIGAFDRTGDAWTELSTAMGLESGDAVDALLGQQATVALRTDQNGTQQIALRSTVRRDARDRVSAAFKPSPRGLVRGIPVLSLGNGSIELAAVPSDARAADGSACSELILAPRGSGALFEDMLRSLREPPPDHALDLAWASLRSLGPSPIAMLLRGKPGDDAPQEFFALAARPTDEGWSADFVATRTMLDAGTGLLSADIAFRDAASKGRDTRPLGVTHPEALARTMRDGALLFMSGPVDLQRATNESSTNSAPAMKDLRDRMPITAAMTRFGFSDAIWSELHGVAFVSVHGAALFKSDPDSDSGQDGIVMSVAFPVRDIDAFAALADAWGLSLAKGQADGRAFNEPTESASIPIGAVRAIEVHGSATAPGLVGPCGAIAWTFAPAAGQDESVDSRRGWWIICAQTGDTRAKAVVDRAQALARDAASPGDASGDIVFRFLSRPALMRHTAGTREPSRGEASATNSFGAAIANHVRTEASSALDSLDRVETVIRRRNTFNELFDGTISVQMRSEP